MGPLEFIAGFGANATSGLINYLGQTETNQSMIDASKDAADVAYARQKELLKMQQEYASPTHQSRMMVDAGINPNLIAGGSIGSVPSAPVVPQASTPNLQSPRLDISLSSELERLANAKSLLSNAENNSKLTDAQVKELLSRNNLNNANVDLVHSSIDKLNAEITKLKIDGDQIQANIDWVYTRNERERMALANDVIDMAKRSAYIDEEFDAYASKLKMTREEYRYFVASFNARLNGLELDNKLTAAQFNLTSRQVKEMDTLLKYADDLYKSESDEARATAAIAGYASELKEKYGDLEQILDLVSSASGTATDFIRVFKRRRNSRHQ